MLLADAVRDRFLMWSNRDVCRQPPFERAFAGATLEEDGGWIAVTGAALSGVKLAGGRVAALRWSWGRETELDWVEAGGDLLPVLQASGDERLELRWKSLGKGWHFPAEVLFVDVFPDWGPERMELSKLKVRSLE